MPGSKAAIKIEIREMATVEDATAFRTLNEEWITKTFSLEARDIEVLSNPQKMIVAKGGRVFVVSADSKAVACVALIPTKVGVYELSKMAVSPKLRGIGMDRRLIEYAIAGAQSEVAVPGQQQQTGQRGAPVRDRWLSACASGTAAADGTSANKRLYGDDTITFSSSTPEALLKPVLAKVIHGPSERAA